MGYVVCVLPISEEQPRGPLQLSRQEDGYSNATVLPHGKEPTFSFKISGYKGFFAFEPFSFYDL